MVLLFLHRNKQREKGVMGLDEYIDKFKGVGVDCSWLVPRVEFNDGFSVSIQCSEYHYSTPRGDVDADLYTRYELGYPSELDSILDGLGEDDGTKETVFPYIEKSIVENLILKHGGIKGVFKRD